MSRIPRVPHVPRHPPVRALRQESVVSALPAAAEAAHQHQPAPARAHACRPHLRRSRVRHPPQRVQPRGSLWGVPRGAEAQHRRIRALARARRIRLHRRDGRGYAATGSDARGLPGSGRCRHRPRDARSGLRRAGRGHRSVSAARGPADAIPILDVSRLDELRGIEDVRRCRPDRRAHPVGGGGRRRPPPVLRRAAAGGGRGRVGAGPERRHGGGQPLQRVAGRRRHPAAAGARRVGRADVGDGKPRGPTRGVPHRVPARRRCGPTSSSRPSSCPVGSTRPPRRS